MYRVPPDGNLQGRTRDNQNTRGFTIQANKYIYVITEYLSFIYVMSYLSGICFVYSYSTQSWNAYVAENSLKIKTEKTVCQLRYGLCHFLGYTAVYNL